MMCDPCRTNMTLLADLIRQEGSESVDLFYSLYPYGNASVKTLLFAMKNKGHRNALAFVSEQMARHIRQDSFLSGVSLVTYAPRRPGEKQRYGFDQAQLLARKIAARLSLPCIPALLRKPGGKKQRGLTGEERALNVKEKFIANPHYDLAGNTVLLIDDVITTGSTVKECASVLKLHMGVHKVYAFSFTSPSIQTDV